MIAPPYYAVIFSSKRTGIDEEGYADMASKMEELAQAQEGFLGMEWGADESNNTSITICYWQDMAPIKQWKANLDHLLAQKYGREKWYEHYAVKIAKVGWV